MKRAFAIALTLLLVLGLLPMPAQAGGGAAGLYWDCCFDNSEETNGWTVINANSDGFGFRVYMDDSHSSYHYRSGGRLTNDSSEDLEASDEYLISPPIFLDAGREYVLQADVGATVPNGSYGVEYEVYVYPGRANLELENLYTYLGQRAYLGWISNSGWASPIHMDLTAYAGQEIRLVFRHKMADASTFWLDNLRIFWEEPAELLGIVTAFNVPMPKLGVNVKTLKESDISFPEFANYTLVPGSLKYYKTVNEQGVEMKDEVFTGTGEYDLRFRVKPKAGVEITETGYASVNGWRALFMPRSDGTVEVMYIPNYRLAPSKEIRDVHLLLDWPVESDSMGKVPSRWLADATEDYHYAVTGVEWSPDTDGAFQHGTMYTATIRLEPDPGWSFSEFVHVTVNGAGYPLKKDSKGWKLIVSFGSTPRPDEAPPVVRFYANGHGAAPLPFRIPAGWSIHDLLGTGIWMNNTDGKIFWGWSESPTGGRDNLFSWTDPVWDDTDLFAVWVDPIEKLSVYVDPPAAFSSGSSQATAYTEKYSHTTAFTDRWYLDAACETPANQKLARGKTYYTKIWLGTDMYQVFSDDVVFDVVGAKLVDWEWQSMDVGLTVSVRIPAAGTVKTAQLFVDTPIPYAPMPMAPARCCLTPGVYMETDDWWDSKDRAGDADWVWGGSFEPGKSFYTVVFLSGDTGTTLATDLQVNAIGAEVCSVESAGGGSYRVVLRVPVKQAYCFSMVSQGSGRFYLSAEHGATPLMDFAGVPRGKYTLKAYPEQGWAFAGWYDGDKLLSRENPYNFTLKKDIDHGKAVFVPLVMGAVDRIDVTVPIPKANSTIDFTKQDAGAEITNNAAVAMEKNRWYHEGGISEDQLTFEGKMKYFIEVDFSANAGRSLASYTRVTINGEDAPFWQQSNVKLWCAASRDYVINPFTDVKEGKYYYDAVMWAISHKPAITGGTTATTFGPSKECTREQVVTFLWKAAGSPEPTSTNCDFTDVNPKKYYYKAILWAVENKITGGISKTRFGVGKSCTRAQVVTFLYAAAGKPDPGLVSSPFTDVKPGDYYYRPVLWAVENGITGGVTATTFGPKKTCTRAQIVTFLYAAYGE